MNVFKKQKKLQVDSYQLTIFKLLLNRQSSCYLNVNYL